MKKFFKILLKLFIILTIWVAGLLFMYLFYKYHNLPDPEDIGFNNNKIIQINYSDNSRIKTVGDLYANQITFNQIPNHLINALIATEDRRFFSHRGFDLRGIVRAFFVNYKSGELKQGASTITQQLARILFLNNKKTFDRKINEILIAHKLEKVFSKEQIIALYLNYAYFGAGNYGISDAAKFYFNKEVANLNLNESAILVGILKAPSKLAPNKNKYLAENRANVVLQNMINSGNLGLDSVKYLEEKVGYKNNKLQEFYFTDYVTSKYQDFLNKKQQEGRFFKINTTLNKELQNLTKNSVDKLYRKYPKRLQNSQVSLLVMSYDGEILSMIGGRNYRESQFNRAVNSNRQIGSISKIFTYLTAFQGGFGPEDIFEDKKIEIGNWRPKNYNNQYYGEISLKKAFAKSLNSVAIQLTQKVGIDNILQNMRKMNIESDINRDLTISLGTQSLTLLELTNAVAIIANGGQYIIPSLIRSIESESKKIIYKRQSSNIGRIFKSKEIDAIKILLRSVITDGTGKNANIAKDIFGKTGTSQDFRDAYFVGFNSDYVIAIWIGNDNNQATNKITGGMLPTLLFKDLINSFSKTKKT